MLIKKQFLSGLLAFVALTLAACGGGGGGGGIQYTGLTTPADIDNTNAATIAALATTVGTVGVEGGLIGATAPDGTTPGGTQSDSTLGIITRTVVAAYHPTSGSVAPLSTDVAPLAVDSGTIAGSCGGSMSYTLNYDSTAYPVPFDGTFTFSQYCEGGVAVTASISLTNGLGYTGYLTFNLSSNEMLSQDQANDKVYKAENFMASFTVYYSGLTITSITVGSSGRFYHPDYGYVIFTTPTALTYFGTDIWPSSGSLTIVEDSTPPVDSATITALSNTQYQLDIDYGNDGGIDETSTGNWADL
jgi:hypothetical protein